MKAGIKDGTLHPMKLKKEMANSVVTKFWSKEEAGRAQEYFEALFQQHDYSKALEVKLKSDLNPIWIIELLKQVGAIKSTSEGSRLISEGAVHIDGEKISDFKMNINWKEGMILKVGKHRIYKLI
jgi:tyrosyl-tRNA synthetase